jgi:hypothetical protein
MTDLSRTLTVILFSMAGIRFDAAAQEARHRGWQRADDRIGQPGQRSRCVRILGGF